MLVRLADLLGARPRAALLAALAVVLAGAVLGAPVAGELSASGGFTPQDADSARALQQVNDANGLQSRPGVVLLVQDATPLRLRELTGQLRLVEGVALVGEPLRPDRGDAVALPATLRADSDDAAVTEALEARFGEQEDVAVGGNIVAFEQIGATVEEDLSRAELLAAPLLLLLSLLFFRGRAALLPLLVGVATVLTTFLVLRLVNQAYELSIFALNLVIGLGLGLAIDYTLFLVTRFREELDRGAEVPAAIRTTMATAGRTVAFSSATVAIALITLTAFPLGFLRSMGIAGAVVAVVAAVASLVMAPALFAVWGATLQLRPRGGSGEGPGRWYRLSHAVMRRPVAVSVTTALVMVVVALPALGVRWTPVDETVIPRDQSARTVADALSSDFPGAGTTPVVVVMTAPEGARAEVAAHAERLGALDGVRTVVPPRFLGRDTWQVDLIADGRPEGDVAHGLVTDARGLDAPFRVLVGGNAAEFVDQQAAIGDRLPLAAGLLVLLTCIVLWLMTGSVVLPLKAVLMNVLTVGVALGAITWVFQGGRLTGLLGYTPNGGIEPTDFLVAAAIVFALSTDYGVFLLERIREARTDGLGDREAVALGLERTGRVVTAAAILLAVAIGAFSTSSISFIQQIGIATAVGVLLDAFVVRALLVPSLMALLGRRNWWSPPVLRRLHARLSG